MEAGSLFEQRANEKFYLNQDLNQAHRPGIKEGTIWKLVRYLEFMKVWLVNLLIESNSGLKSL